MIEWIKNCEICNVGVCKRVDAQKHEVGGAKAVCKIMEAEPENNPNGEPIWTWNHIYQRYRYYKGLKVSKRHCEIQECQIVEGVVSDLASLIERGDKFGTIYADPPWPYQNQATRSATSGIYKPGEWRMSLEDLCNIPIQELTTERAHLHLWTTNAFLFDAKTVLEAWGFEYKSVFVWVKPQIGIGNYWRVSHEFLLLGVKGAQTFMDRTQKSWEELPRGKHSQKPEEIADKIQKVSPGPYLELFARRGRKMWTVWGNEISGTLFDGQRQTQNNLYDPKG
jgi:N6-adenosine-specific RNA methylase IME4